MINSSCLERLAMIEEADNLGYELVEEREEPVKFLLWTFTKSIKVFRKKGYTNDEQFDEQFVGSA